MHVQVAETVSPQIGGKAVYFGPILHGHGFSTTRVRHGDTDLAHILVFPSVFQILWRFKYVCPPRHGHGMNFGVPVLLVFDPPWRLH